ncbi:hypothetical protein MRX96_030428 [Rhipicephalus microplus]
MGDTLLDTTRAKEAVRQQTTLSGLEEFINFDDDDFTGQAEPSGTSGTSSEQRTERGLVSLLSPFGLDVQAATVKSIGDIFREGGFREDFAGAARMNKFALAFRIVNNIVCDDSEETEDANTTTKSTESKEAERKHEVIPVRRQELVDIVSHAKITRVIIGESLARQVMEYRHPTPVQRTGRHGRGSPHKQARARSA